VSLPGFTPGLPDVFGVPVQPLNLSPPGVCFVCESADGLLVEVAVFAELLDWVFDSACAVAFACAVADAFALGPAVELDADDSSAFFA
jgi:hypothetical protein